MFSLFLKPCWFANGSAGEEIAKKPRLKLCLLFFFFFFLKRESECENPQMCVVVFGLQRVFSTAASLWMLRPQPTCGPSCPGHGCF